MKRLLLLLVAAYFLTVGVARAQSSANKGPHETIEAAVTAAAEKQKLLFISYGREACGNCRSLKKLIKERKVSLPDFEWVQADIDCDDPSKRAEFNKRYRDAFKDARTLPFVVIAKPDGTLVASSSGYMDEQTLKKFVRDARSQAKRP